MEQPTRSPLATRMTWALPAVAGLLAALGVVALGSGPAGFVVAALAALAGVAVMVRDAPWRTAPDGRDGLVEALDRHLSRGGASAPPPALLLVEVEGLRELAAERPQPEVEAVLAAAAERLEGLLGDGDRLARLDATTFGLALDPFRAASLEARLELAGQVRRAMARPYALPGGPCRLPATLGLAVADRLDDRSGEGCLRAASLALLEAHRTGPGSLRSYSDVLAARARAPSDLAGDVARAFERGEIAAHFQPQVSTRTGALTGFEALARWQHPGRGLLPPAEFLPAVARAGLMPALAERMIDAALGALAHWEEAGFDVPSVSVNLSHEELGDPRLVERLGWDLDRCGLSPDRLVVEVGESVLALADDDPAVRTLAGLVNLGCCVNLDDVGDADPQPGALRRLSIERVTIGRAHVGGLDRDPEQARVVGAILAMAERFGLDTLAEGVETEGERQALARLGCGHVQGYGIARPMPVGDSVAWLRRAAARDGAGAARLRAV